MDFTEIYSHNRELVSFSTGTHFILSAVQDRLIVRRADTLQITRWWQVDLKTREKDGNKPVSSSDNSISHIGWSCDSEYVLAACAKKGVVQIYKLRDDDWSCTLDSGAEVKAEWAPDGRHVLCFSEWGLRVTVWSLVTGRATYIQYPAHPDKGYAFRKDGRYLAVAERHRSKDSVGFYDCDNSYKMVRHFPLPTSSLASISLSPSGAHLAVWEGPLEFKLHIMNIQGNVIATFSPDPDPGLGIRCVTWNPHGSFLAVSGYEDQVHFLDSLSWTSVAKVELLAKIPNRVKIWREPSKWLEATEGRGFLSYEQVHGPMTLPIRRADAGKANPKSGAVQLQWDISGLFLLVRFESIPNVAHIYAFPSSSDEFNPRLRSVLIHAKPILSASWNPARKGYLALCSGGCSFYLWNDEWTDEKGESIEAAECIGVPAQDFDVRNLKWASDGKGLILISKETFCCAFEVQE